MNKSLYIVAMLKSLLVTHPAVDGGALLLVVIVSKAIDCKKLPGQIQHGSMVA